MMSEGESRFVEEMGQILASYGMTPMAGRMWGWLLICEPPEQTAAELADALHASRGAISGTARRHGPVHRGCRQGLRPAARDAGARAVRHRRPTGRHARPPPGAARRHGLHRDGGAGRLRPL